MRHDSLFRHYNWLIETINNAQKITLKEIQDRWADSQINETGEPMSRSTFNRHKEAIEETFGIQIKCDVKDNYKYYIANQEAFKENSIQNWMLSTLSVNNLLGDSLKLYNRILLESIPSSGDNLQKFIDAMKAELCVKVVYTRYGQEPTERLLEPYCIKLTDRRWYALVKSTSSGRLFTLAFDRIRELSITDQKFKIDETFDASDYFNDCYGIFKNEEVKCQRVVIRAYGREVYYMRDLPFHASQKEIATTEDYSDFELYLRPSNDFFSPLLSRGENIKILEPLSLAEEIKKMHLKAFELYK